MANNVQGRNSQLNYDMRNLKNDAKEVAYIKKQADAAPGQQVSRQLAQQLNTAHQNYATNLRAVTVDVAVGGGASSPQALASLQGYVNELTKGVQDNTSGLEGGNNLDGTLKDMGSSAGVLHVRQDQINTARADLNTVTRERGANPVADTTHAVHAADDLVSGINAQSVEPYAAGHQAAPAGGYDVYDPHTSQNSVDNPKADLETPVTKGSTADLVRQLAEILGGKVQ